MADVGFIVRTEGVTEKGGAHGEAASVPGVGERPRGRVWPCGTSGEGVEETGIAIMGVEGAE